MSATGKCWSNLENDLESVLDRAQKKLEKPGKMGHGKRPGRPDCRMESGWFFHVFVYLLIGLISESSRDSHLQLYYIDRHLTKKYSFATYPS